MLRGMDIHRLPSLSAVNNHEGDGAADPKFRGQRLPKTRARQQPAQTTQDKIKPNETNHCFTLGTRAQKLRKSFRVLDTRLC